MFKIFGFLLSAIPKFLSKSMEVMRVRWSYNRLRHSLELLRKAESSYYRLNRLDYHEDIQDIIHKQQQLMNKIKKIERYEGTDD